MYHRRQIRSDGTAETRRLHKSSDNQRRYKWLKLLEIAVAASLPVVTAVHGPVWVTGGLAAVIVADVLRCRVRPLHGLSTSRHHLPLTTPRLGEELYQLMPPAWTPVRDD